MSETRTHHTPWRTVTANAADPSDNGFTPVSDWFDIAGLQEGRCSVEVRNLTGELELIGAIQLADHPRDGSPTTTNLGSTWADADGFVDASTFTDLSTAAAGAQVARLGFVTRNDEGSALSSCEVQGTWDLTMKERLSDVVLDWDPCICNSASPVFFPATEWMDTFPTRSMRAVVELRGKTGGFMITPAYQLADDIASPATTAAIGSPQSSDGIGYPTTWQTPSTPRRKLRFGWLVRLTSGGATAYGTARARIQRLTE